MIMSNLSPAITRARRIAARGLVLECTASPRSLRIVSPAVRRRSATPAGDRGSRPIVRERVPAAAACSCRWRRRAVTVPAGATQYSSMPPTRPGRRSRPCRRGRRREPPVLDLSSRCVMAPRRAGAGSTSVTVLPVRWSGMCPGVRLGGRSYGVLDANVSGVRSGSVPPWSRRRAAVSSFATAVISPSASPRDRLARFVLSAAGVARARSRVSRRASAVRAAGTSTAGTLHDRVFAFLPELPAGCAPPARQARSPQHGRDARRSRSARSAYPAACAPPGVPPGTAAPASGPRCRGPRYATAAAASG